MKDESALEMATQAAEKLSGSLKPEDESLMRNAPEKPGKTRFVTQSKACKFLNATGDYWRDATLIVKGHATTLDDCATALSRKEDKGYGVRASNFVDIISDEVNRANMSATAVKFEILVQPLHSEHEVGQSPCLSCMKITLTRSSTNSVVSTVQIQSYRDRSARLPWP